MGAFFIFLPIRLVIMAKNTGMKLLSHKINPFLWLNL